MGWPEAKIKTPPPWKKECHYTDKSRDVMEITPPSDLEICLSIDFAPLGPRDCPRAISRTSGCKLHDLIFEMPLPLCYKQGPQISWWRPIPIFQVMPPPSLFFRQQALRPNAYLASQQTEENPITTSDLSFAPIEPQQLQSCTDTSHLSCWVEVHQTGSPLSSLWLR